MEAGFGLARDIGNDVARISPGVPENFRSEQFCLKIREVEGTPVKTKNKVKKAFFLKQPFRGDFMTHAAKGNFRISLVRRPQK